jgi:DNA-binding response OmpR family regulator
MSPGSKASTVSPRASGDDCRNIVVADEDKIIVDLVVETLLNDGHAVFRAYDGLSATQLALGLEVCDLVISNTRVGDTAGLDLIHELRARMPTLAILYLANQGRSTAELEGELPEGVPILRELFTAARLRAAGRPLLAY